MGSTNFLTRLRQRSSSEEKLDSLVSRLLQHCGEDPDELEPDQLPGVIDHYVQGDPYRVLAALEAVRTDRESGGMRRSLTDAEREARPPNRPKDQLANL